MKDLAVKAFDLQAGDRLYAETAQGETVTVLVHGVYVHNWSTKRDRVTVYTRNADFDYRGDETLQVQRKG